MCCVLFFFSCETEGQLTGSEITPDQDQYDPSSPDGNGIFVGEIADLYFDLNSTETYNESFWKFSREKEGFKCVIFYP